MASPRTRWTNPEQEDFVILHHKAVRSGSFFFHGTTGQFKGAVTLTAMEVVVMSLAGTFVQGPEGGVGDAPEPAVVNEDFEVAINRGLVEGLDHFTSIGQDLGHSQWSILLQEDLFDGCSLCCFASQGKPLVYT